MLCILRCYFNKQKLQSVDRSSTLRLEKVEKHQRVFFNSRCSLYEPFCSQQAEFCGRIFKRVVAMTAQGCIKTWLGVCSSNHDSQVAYFNLTACFLELLCCEGNGTEFQNGLPKFPAIIVPLRLSGDGFAEQQRQSGGNFAKA